MRTAVRDRNISPVDVKLRSTGESKAAADIKLSAASAAHSSGMETSLGKTPEIRVKSPPRARRSGVERMNKLRSNSLESRRPSVIGSRSPFMLSSECAAKVSQRVAPSLPSPSFASLSLLLSQSFPSASLSSLPPSSLSPSLPLPSLPLFRSLSPLPLSPASICRFQFL